MKKYIKSYDNVWIDHSANISFPYSQIYNFGEVLLDAINVKNKSDDRYWLWAHTINVIDAYVMEDMAVDSVELRLTVRYFHGRNRVETGISEIFYGYDNLDDLIKYELDHIVDVITNRM